MSGAEPRLYTVELVTRSWLSPRVYQVELARPPSLTFRAGQRVRIHRGSTERDYTLACGPESRSLTLCVRLVERGMISPALSEARLGSTVEVSGPHGYFVYQESSRPAVFVATGTGVAPFVAMTAAGIRPRVMLHGVKTVEDLHYQEALRETAWEYVPCLTQAAGSREDAAGVYHGRVTAWLQDHLPKGAYDFYLCGNSAMVRDVMLLADERFPDSRVFTEVFH